ncbi:hypothetical protein [Paenibacillus sp. FJAT-26967]|uniref:hypothetical protein n=1 Tax=Paenibacillus sp. FJAT-26967 TaxID=1729690 RepID=UPI00083965D2|nr:hypothetical protein [Paenibacillus sp. FJAT-26967]
MRFRNIVGSALIIASVLVSGFGGKAEAAVAPVNQTQQLTPNVESKVPQQSLADPRTQLDAPKAGKLEARLQNSLVTTAINDSPGSAATVVTGAVYSDKISEASGQRWYVLQTNSPGKLTAYLQTVQSASVDYDLYLFRYDPATSQLVEQEVSSYGPGSNEQISRIAPAGIYFLAVDAYAGFDAVNPYYFTVVQSPVYDAAEPDDNIWHAQLKTDSFTVNQQTIDNTLDADWFKLTVTASKKFHINLSNTAAGTNYQLQIFNQNLGSVGSVNQNTNVDASLGAGTYYLRVVSLNSSNASAPYTLAFNEFKTPTQVNIQSITSDPNIDAGARINYGQGNKWRVQNYMTVTGLAQDASGAPAFNAPVTVLIQTKLNNQVYSASTTTSSTGSFSVTISGIQPAIGQNMFTGYASYHYYDIIPFQVYSNGNQLVSNDSSLYHFGYSIYRPH